MYEQYGVMFYEYVSGKYYKLIIICNERKCNNKTQTAQTHCTGTQSYINQGLVHLLNRMKTKTVNLFISTMVQDLPKLSKSNAAEKKPTWLKALRHLLIKSILIKKIRP